MTRISHQVEAIDISRAFMQRKTTHSLLDELEFLDGRAVFESDIKQTRFIKRYNRQEIRERSDSLYPEET